MLNVPLAKVKGNIEAAKKLGFEGVEELERRAVDLALEEDSLRRFLAEKRGDSKFLNSPLQRQFTEYLARSPSFAKLSFSVFYRIHREEGLVFRPLVFAAHVFRPVAKRHRSDFLTFCASLLLSPDEYHLIWVDESAVAPSNFKRRAWRLRGAPHLTRTRIRYEKLSIIGAIDLGGLVAAQFVRSGLGGKTFTEFICRVARELSHRRRDRRKIVVFLDNASSHRSPALLDFCDRNNVLLLFNLPQRSPLNMIEYAWEFAKRELRSMTTYRK